MDAERVLWLLIATISIPSFSQARYMVKNEGIEDNDMEAMTPHNDIIRTPKVIETTGVLSRLVGRNRKPERPNEDKETSITDGSNISRSKKRYTIVKTDPPQWEIQRYG